MHSMRNREKDRKTDKDRHTETDTQRQAQRDIHRQTHIDRHRNRHTETGTKTHTHTDTKRHTHRQTHIDRHTETDVQIQRKTDTQTDTHRRRKSDKEIYLLTMSQTTGLASKTPFPRSIVTIAGRPFGMRTSPLLRGWSLALPITSQTNGFPEVHSCVSAREEGPQRSRVQGHTITLSVAIHNNTTLHHKSSDLIALTGVSIMVMVSMASLTPFYDSVVN